MTLEMITKVNNNSALCSQQTTPITCVTGNFSTNFRLGTAGSVFSDNNIDYYIRTIEEVDCNTGSNPAGLILYQDATQVPTDPNGSLSTLFLNSLPIAGPMTSGYFTDKYDLCYKLTVEVGNVCDNTKDWTYFKITDINDQYRLRNNPKDQEASVFGLDIYPNPVRDNFVNFNYYLNETDKVNFAIISTDGKVVKRGEFVSKLDGASQEKIDVTNLPNGIYFVQSQSNGKMEIDKFIKQ
jgi:hypothetical protein